ncbi:alkaline phosphatase family protein [Phenylobacterium sp.]|uniref:alkaline phosphatase family protein n=1 Tax=Phenylobacterium sp. TaxID=1871053 RepID=UPI003561CF4E
MTASRRVVMIGLDAGDRELLAAYGAELPNISRLFAEGVEGKLEAEPLSGSLWPSFYTRGGPGGHGIYQHLQWDPDRMKVRRLDRSWLQTRPFWRDLGEQGVRVTAVDVPFVLPGETSPNVLEVMNWGSQDQIGSFWATDKPLGRRILAEFGPHPMGIEIPVPKTAAQLKRMTEATIKGAGVKGRLTVALMRERPWDLFIVAFGETHRAGHTLWTDPACPAPDDALIRVYKAVDAAVGAIKAEAGPDTEIVLFALHGMGLNCSQSHLTSIFMQRALARFRGRPAPQEKGEAPGLFRALRRRLPAGLQLTVANLVPQWVRDTVVSREIDGGYRWSDTLGFCLHGDLAGCLRLNIKGREAKGVLSEREAADLKAFLRTELEALRLPDGRPVVRSVMLPTEELPGPRAHLLPDILAEWNPDIGAAHEVHSPNLGVIRARPETGRGGNHRFNGFYVHAGPSQKSNVRPRRVSQLGDLVEALI